MFIEFPLQIEDVVKKFNELKDIKDKNFAVQMSPFRKPTSISVIFFLI